MPIDRLTRARALAPCPPRLAGAAAAALLWGSCCSVAAAQPAATEPIRIRFAAAPGCPDGEAFTRQVWARTARARLAAEGEAARTIQVEITAAPEGFRGQLAVEEPRPAPGAPDAPSPRGQSAVREVGGASCDEVVSALALITALTIDPQASTAPTPPPPAPTPAAPAPATGPTTPSPAPAPAPTPAQPPALAPPLRVPAAPPWTPGTTLPGVATIGSVGGEAPSTGPAVPAPPWRFGVGAQVVGVFGIAPAVTPGAFLLGDVARLGDSVIAPTFRIGALLATSETVRTAAGTGRFEWVAAHLEGCPMRLRGGPLSLVPCAVVEVGSLRGQGAGEAYSAEVTRPWFAAGLSGRTELRVVEGLSLEIQGALTFPFVRDAFYLEPATTVHEVPAVGGAVGGGLLVHFP